MIDGGHRKINPKIKVTMLILLSIVNLTVNKTKGNRYLDQKINILIWTTSDYPPLVDMVKDKLKKCIFKNCIVTKYKFINNGVKKYDIILFDIIELRDKYMQLPKHRSEQQQYVFVSREPPSLYDLPNVFDDIFNLTWTYKLNSDVTLTYLVIKNKVGTVIGPKRNIKWMNINDMKPISKKNKLKLQYKQKAAAWFVSHCNAPSGRQHYVQDLLQTELNKYQLKVDVFGKCGDQEECLKEGELCYDMLKSDYYFYLAFENSICEDYVTEKVLTATKHFTVPIVLGGADYTRFVCFPNRIIISNLT